MSFYSVISKKSYSELIGIMKCIENISKTLEISIETIVETLNEKYPGVEIMYYYYSIDGSLKLIVGNELKTFTPQGEVSIDISHFREDAEKSVKYMAINVTGARPGETLVGIHCTAMDSVMKVVDGIIPPMKDDIDKIRVFPDLWKRFINKLSIVEYFNNLSDKEREKWIIKHSKAGDYDIAEVGNIFVEVLEVGKSKYIEILEPDTITEILAGNPEREDRGWNVMHLRNLFPFKPGSKGLKGRPVLMYYLHFWKISIAYQSVDSFDGLIYDMKTGFQQGEKERPIILFDNLPKKIKNKEIIEKQSLGIILYEPGEKLDYFSILIKEKKCTQDDIDIVTKACKNFTAAGYKSLLQKIIRYAPKQISIQDENYESDVVLFVVFTLLLVHPGSFVPDIQRFVSGQESAIKRLSVTILEDSSLKLELNDWIERLGILSFLSQRMSGWKPSKKDFLWMITICSDALTNRSTYVHNIKKGFELHPYTLSINNSPLENYSALLDEIKSFSTDLAMTRFIASNGGNQILDNSLKRPNAMHIYHCIDHHWAPEIAYFFSIETVNSFKEKGSKPFAKLFNYVFMNITGINSRRKGTGLSGHEIRASKEFINETKTAQELVLKAKQYVPRALKKTDLQYNIRVKLDVSWIAGLVGTIEIAGNPPVMVTMKPEDPYQLIAIRKPSRGMKDGTLTDQRTEEAIKKAKDILSKTGILLNKANAPIPALKNCRIKLMNDEYIFLKDRNPPKSWKNISRDTLNFYFCEESELTLENSLKFIGDGLQLNAYDRFEKLLEEYSIDILRRLLTYISSYRAVIEISRISKDGGGTAAAVVIEDVGACQLLMYISLLFPRALRRVEGYSSKFDVVCGPMLWEIRDIVRKVVKKHNESSNGKILTWGKFKDTSGRIPRNYQIDTLNEMIDKNKKEKKGHFLWIPVGMGKSLIALSFLEYLNNNNKLPKYVIYALPKSALESILNEIRYFKIPVNLLMPIKTWKKHPNAKEIKNNVEIIENHINIIEHDHLRLLEEEISTKAPNSIIIIDEVHKALNDTKRTSVALEMSRLCIDFIAMTGTPVVDSNTYKLIWWLEQIVDFEVNEKNFWVAANGMIAKKVNTGVFEDKEDVVVEMTSEERKIYNLYVPQNMGGSNNHPTSKDIQKAFELCYEVCDRKMIEMITVFLKSEKGVMLVVRDEKHQNKMNELLISSGVKSKDIFLLQGKNSIYLTDESVKNKEVHDYKVVIVPKIKSEGYTLTRLQVMITSVYPSNQSTREQLEGRINRLSQHNKVIYYRTVHTGILTYVLQKHKDAASLSAVLSALADEIELKEF